MNRNSWIIVGASLFAAIACILVFKNAAHAADLGGNCCVDLEERIADLEATAAKKGNRKVSLEVYGQVNAALSYVDFGSFHKTQVIQNGNDPSVVGFVGKAKVTPDIVAGYKIEIALDQLGLLNLPVGNTPVMSVRQSYWFIRSEAVGGVSIGKQAQATRDFNMIDTSNSWIAQKELSFGSLSDVYLTGIDLPVDGNYKNLVRYDSPVWAGFMASATWGSSTSLTGKDASTWDVALRYAGEPWPNTLKVAAGVGYRHDTDLTANILGFLPITLPTGDVNTVLVSASAMHVPTGVFVTGEYSNQDWTAFHFTYDAYSLTGGVEERWFQPGKTTLYGNFEQLSFHSGGTTNVSAWGLGAVQAVDSAAMDLYAQYENYQTKTLLGNDVNEFTAGAKIKF